MNTTQQTTAPGSTTGAHGFTGTTATNGATTSTTNANTVPTSKTTTNPVRQAVAAVHGAGEVVRGTINGAVEGVFNESGGVARNEGITSAGIDEIETGRLTREAKQREGVARRI